MSRPLMIAIVAVLVLGALGLGLWYQRQHPRRIVGQGTIQVRSERPGGGTATHATRDVDVNGVVFKEVALPNGTWIDCAGDCAKAVRDAGEGFWDQRQRDHR